MGDILKSEYTVVPEGSYKIIRNCAGCEHKSVYVNTGRFRINANGNKVDVWLIYQCEKCRHTYNLTIWERVSPASIIDEYDRFLANDAALALQYGTDKSLFGRSKAQIDAEDMRYTLEPGPQEAPDGRFVIHNPYELRIRTEKAAAEVLHITRSAVKRLMADGKLTVPGGYLARENEFHLTSDQQL